MRNDKKYNLAEIWEKIRMLPSFTADDLAFLKVKREYLNIILSRWSKSGKVLRLKKGLYVPSDFISRAEKTGDLSGFTEYAANALYPASYLSLEFVLYEHNALTEMPKNFTSVSLNKTAEFSNFAGRFIYHKIKKNLFIGFKVEKKSGFSILKASPAKALFDYLYFRKDMLAKEGAIKELRLNTGVFAKSDRAEIDKYARLAGSKKLKEIIHTLWRF